MKTAFKLSLVLFLFLNIRSKAQVADTLDKYPETVLIKIVESNSFGLINNIDSKMIVVDPQNRTSIKDLKRVNFSFNGNDGIEFNTLAIQKEIQKWHNLGYTVKSTSAVAPKETIVVTTIILQKN